MEDSNFRWKEGKSWFNFPYNILQIVSFILTSIAGLFEPITIARYPAQQPNLGNTMAGVISLSNISATLIFTRKLPKPIKIRKIIGMMVSVVLGIVGFIGLTYITPIPCREWNSYGFFSVCTKYGVHRNTKSIGE